MKIERTRNATRNILFGGIQKVYQVLVPFIMRTIMIYVMGINYLGLNSLFTSVLQVLNMAEMGVGMAMVYSMYEPIARDDKEKVCALMRLYKIYYRVIGAVVLCGGIIIIPVLPNLIKSDLPQGINLYVLYLLNLLATVSTYWLFAYKHSLLYAHQRSDVGTKVAICTDTCKYILQIVALVVFKNYYLYTIVIILIQIVTNILTAIVTTKMYPQYKAEGKLSKSEVSVINGKIRDLFTSKIGVVVFRSVDTIIISAYLGLEILAIYQNYYFVVTSLTSIIGIIFTSCVAGIGNSIIVETEEKNFKDLKKYTFIIMWVSGFCTVCMLCLYQPFMKIWVTEKFMLDFKFVIGFCIYFFINQINSMLESYKDAAGIWHEDRYRPLVLAVLNLLLNILLVQPMGLGGVLLASCFTKGIIGIPWVLHNLFTTVFNKNLGSYVKDLVRETVVVLITSILIAIICNFIPIGGIAGLLVKAVVCLGAGNILLIIFWKRKTEFKEVMLMVRKMVPSKIRVAIDFLTR